MLANPERNKKGASPLCPVCNTPRAADAPYKPFCSRRCADVDLHRWLSGGYAIPAAEDDDEESGGPAGEQE